MSQHTDIVVEASAAATPYGLLAEFADEDRLLRAARRVRDAGYTRWDCCTPFPVHGLDQAMSARPTKLPLIVFLAGLSGAILGLGLVWYTNVFDYPYVISGKPIFSLPANIPVIFEMTVLLAAFGAVFGMILLNKLPRLYHPVFKSERFARVSTDRFFIVIEASDPAYDAAAAEELLRSAGASAVESLED